ncbi:DNA-binding transcriptional MerR regulator [Rhodobacter aestuarii]|uniref:DNA-binding transcriptional regulator, MerR family n=1 Tax=Rhodobacter aestuarii TaxID=453582 RepID=A0A1N7K8K0_9RHOB|nr:MerR family transcriptional regulator [Rhodobacter aestuarii]PTV95811.1 DNA-binding transcriptional MerR regulator [Rhodobacter aestuarii]SIS57909.1 DNA-binding transcriptional regulator, MerR family [Rhodobacter aestuarii]
MTDPLPKPVSSDTEPDAPPPLFRVTEAARAAGVAPSTLRLWETQGLVTPQRRASGQRLYAAADVARLQRIAYLRREAGLNPAAIRAALESENSAPTEAAITNEPLGAALRQLRQARGETLEAVAQAVGASASGLSTLERTGAGVSFKTLADLAQYYGTTVSRLSGQEEEGHPVVRAGAARIWPMPVEGVRVEVLAEGERQMDCHRFILAPGAASEGGYGHAGEEFITVIEGRFRITLDGDELHELGPGDSIYFESRRPHAWANAADGRTVVIWVNTPPTF